MTHPKNLILVTLIISVFFISGTVATYSYPFTINSSNPESQQNQVTQPNMLTGLDRLNSINQDQSDTSKYWNELTSINISNSVFTDMVIEDDMAYISDQSGLYVYDISDITNISTIAFIETNSIETITVFQNYLVFITAEDFSSRKLHVANLSTFETIASFSLDEYQLLLDINNHVPFFPMGDAIIVVSNYKFLIFNFTESLEMNTISSYTFDRVNAYYQVDVELVDSSLLIISQSAFTIIDLANPANPSQVAKYSNFQGHTLAVEGDLAVLGNYSQYVFVNISSYSNVTFLASYSSSNKHFEISNGFLYMLGSGIRVYNISDPTNLDFQYSTPSDPYYHTNALRKVLFKDNVLFTLSDRSTVIFPGLQVFSENRNGYNIERVAHIDPISGYFDNLYLNGDTGYVSSTEDGILSFDLINNTINLQQRLDFGDGHIGVFYDDNSIFVNPRNLRLNYLNASDPANIQPTEIQSPQLNINTVYWTEDYFFVFTYGFDRTVYVYNLASFPNLFGSEVARFSLSDYSVRSITHHNNHLVILGYQNLTVFNITNINAVTPVYSMETTAFMQNGIQSMQQVGDTVILQGQNNNLKLFSLNDSSLYQVSGFPEYLYSVNRVFVEEGLMFVYYGVTQDFYTGKQRGIPKLIVYNVSAGIPHLLELYRQEDVKVPYLLDFDKDTQRIFGGIGYRSNSGGSQAKVELFLVEVNFDHDSDGLQDREEREIYLTNPYLNDTDSDGLLDSDEIFLYQTDPLVDDSTVDTDSDGLSNAEEILTFGTNHTMVDTDLDGFSDKIEVDTGTDPLDASDFPITSSDETTSYSSSDQSQDTADSPLPFPSLFFGAIILTLLPRALRRQLKH